VLFTVVCIVVLLRRGAAPLPGQPPAAVAAAAVLAGVAFFTVSFLAVPPIDPNAFYHQRYAFPLLALVLGGAPAVVVQGASGRRLRGPCLPAA
jgi:hypothetical protein